jgi:hypothetical protein
MAAAAVVVAAAREGHAHQHQDQPPFQGHPRQAAHLGSLPFNTSAGWFDQQHLPEPNSDVIVKPAHACLERVVEAQSWSQAQILWTIISVLRGI